MRPELLPDAGLRPGLLHVQIFSLPKRSMPLRQAFRLTDLFSGERHGV
jgi:hypothetical protein